MTDDASTAYICIYCPFNSDNLQALENHLASAHEHGCQDALPTPNITIKANKREAPDDEKSRSSFDDTEETTGVKRVKRTPSPRSTNLYINSSDEHIESEEEQEDDERDSSSNLKTMLICPLCGTTYDRLDHLFKHAKRKHQLDLRNSNGTNPFNQFSTGEIDRNNPIETIETGHSNEEQSELLPSTSESNTTTTTTDCPYCDYKTTDIEQFKPHIVAHIRDKNYRCLLCNRLYKYRGDCSFHIRRKHHRYSVNSNDYIQRFLFDTTDGDESMSTQSGTHGISSTNGSTTNLNTSREQEEPVRYFGCPYCDYTSNYGGDVRKHQARKHPNSESKVVKIIRKDSEMHRNALEDDEDEDNSNANIHLLNKIKSNKKPDKSLLPPPPQPSTTPMPILSNFAPVRVFQCSACHQQGTYKWVVERHIRAKHPDQANVHVIELPAELSVKLQKITSPLKRFRCSLCPLQSKHSWVVVRHIKHFHTLQTASVLDIQPDGKAINEDLLANPNDDLSNHQDSDSSSMSSSCNDLVHQGVAIDDESQPSSLNNHFDSMIFTYKCSLCDYQSNVSWNIQNHINEIHSDQSNAVMLTQCRPRKLSSIDPEHSKMNISNKKSKGKNGFNRSLSPTSALAKAKFSPAVEEALMSLQGSKLNPNLYAVQPKFGIKRLKCRHCFYRSNWKTDMIRHVRIRHNLTEPDHNKDMITMSEQEARSTIELYENTFGKELRRRTFRTWNDWAKAEQEFNPKDGSLHYNNGQSTGDQNPSIPKKISSHKGQKSSNNDLVKMVNQIGSPAESEQKFSSSHLNQTSKEEFKQLPNPSNIVSRLLLTISPSDNDNNDGPLDLSLKSSKSQIDEEEEMVDENSSVTYLCSVCPYKHSNWSLVQSHLSLHLTGQGYACPLCSYTKSTTNSLVHHLTISHPTSQIPTKFSRTSVNESAHILEQHQCSLCSYQCDRSDALNFHRRLEHDDEEFDIDSSDGEDDVIASTTKNLFDCPLCSPSSNTSDYINLEQLTMHVITKHNNQSCPFCSYVIPMNNNNSISQLIEHVKLHFNGILVQPDPLLGIEQVKELLMLE